MGQEAKRCTRCILTDACPRITFDEEGVCCYCHSFDRRWKHWKPGTRESRFLAILNKARKRNPKYHALVGLSGGKDSCYTLHVMVKKYKVQVLAHTYDNGLLSDGARKNIELMVNSLGVEHKYVSTDPKLLKCMYLALLKNNCSDFCIICSNGALASINRLVLRENIPVVVWGLSPRTEPIMPLELLNAYDYRYMVNVMKPYVMKSELENFKHVDLVKVFYLTFLKRVHHLFLPEYIQWNEQKNAEVLAKEYGWVDYGQGRPHFDCVADRAINYCMNKRLGISKVPQKLSQMVRSGQMTREQALKKLEENDDIEEPVEVVDTLCRRLDITREDLKPLLEGTAVDYRCFKGYARFLQKLRCVFWIIHKLGLTSESIYQKYS